MEKIAIENMRFKAYHGVYPKENSVGAAFIVDVYIDYDFSKAYESDALTDTIDYAQVFLICKKEMAQISKLIEHVAYRIKQGLADEFQLKKKSIHVKITKLNPPIKGFTGQVSVEC